VDFFDKSFRIVKAKVAVGIRAEVAVGIRAEVAVGIRAEVAPRFLIFQNILFQ
jgi:hypothetical protein